jgi:type I restriction enzyme M protein
MVALPGQLFYNTQIPACLWFVTRDKKDHRFRGRSGEVLFIDARKMGVMVDRRHKEFTDEDIGRIASTYHTWRGECGECGDYKDVPGFCRAVTLDEIRKHGHILTPGRYVGAEVVGDGGEPFDEKMKRLTAELSRQFEKSKGLEEEMRKNLAGLGFKI